MQFTATRARSRTPTQAKLAHAVTHVHCNKLRCTYVQRALHVTHVCYRRLFRPRSFALSSLLIFPLFYLSSSLTIPSHSYIHARVCIYSRLFLLSSVLLFVGQRLYPSPPPAEVCAPSSIQIYTPKCTHETTKSACGCWPRARCIFFLLAGQPSPFIRCTRVGTLCSFQRFATTSFSVHVAEQR